VSTSEGDVLYAAIDAKLTSVLGSLPVRPPWSERWRRLNHASSDEERLAVYRAIRDSGVLPDDAGFYLVSWQIDAIAGHRAEEALHHLDERLRSIESAHGLGEGEVWEPGEAPAEYQDVLENYRSAWAEIFAAELEKRGEPAIAALFRTDPEAFERRSETGRQFFHGARLPGDGEVPPWLDALVDAVGVSLTPESLMGPLGFAYREEDGFCEIDVYPTPVELVGGAEDGAVVSPAFSLDLEQLRAAFARVDDLGWNALGWADGGGPFIWVEGAYQGHELFLRVLAHAPEGEEPGAKVWIPPAGAE
jgi:hypothetical protein